MREPPTLQDAERFVGKPYLLGVYDCADLAMQVQWELFGRLIALPTDRARPAGQRAQGRMLDQHRADVAVRMDSPAHGCGVLMWETAAGGEPQWHIGTAFLQGGMVWVLHSTVQAGGVLQRLGDLGRFGLHVEGFYAWL